jgi:hypothetical protein
MRNSSPDGLSSGSFRSPGWYKVGGTVLAKWYSPSKMVVLMAVQPRRWCAFENKKVDSVRNYPYHYSERDNPTLHRIMFIHMPFCTALGSTVAYDIMKRSHIPAHPLSHRNSTLTTHAPNLSLTLNYPQFNYKSFETWA